MFAPDPKEYDIHRETHFGDRDMLCYSVRPQNMLAVFDGAVAHAPDRIAIFDTAGALSYAALDRNAANLAAGLAMLGLAKGDRIALNMSNRAEFVVAMIACFKAGFIAMPVGHRHRTAELVALYTDAGVRAAIFDDITAAEQPAPDMVETLQFLIGADAARPEAIAFDTVMDRGVGQVQVPSPITEEACAILLYTSGTTGRPKGAKITHLGMVHSVMHFQQCLALEEGDCTIVAVPCTHVTGLVAQILVMFQCAGTTVMMKDFDVHDFTALAQKYGMTYTVLVPAMYALLLHRKALAPEGLEKWRIGAFGGAPMPDAIREELARVLPHLSLHNAYGATETTSPTTIVPVGVDDCGDSVGRVVPCGEIRIIDDSGADVADGQEGELLIRGPMVVPGYWNNPDANAASFAGDYWKSGDIAMRDQLGNIRILDRKKDMINRGGYKIFSAEIENLLMLMEGVEEAAVVPYPCPILGERAHAFVFTRGSLVTKTDLHDFLSARVADYKVPDRITICDEPLPRNVNGKIIKAVLRTRATDGKQNS